MGLGVLEILERAGRPVGAERFHQRRRSGRGAEPCIGIDGRDAQAGARDLAERVVLLEEQLTAVVDCRTVGSVGCERVVEPVDDQLHRLVP